MECCIKLTNCFFKYKFTHSKAYAQLQTTKFVGEYGNSPQRVHIHLLTPPVFSIFAQFLDWSIKVPNSTVELRLKLFVYWLIVKIVTDLLQCTVFY